MCFFFGVVCLLVSFCFFVVICFVVKKNRFVVVVVLLRRQIIIDLTCVNSEYCATDRTLTTTKRCSYIGFFFFPAPSVRFLRALLSLLFFLSFSFSPFLSLLFFLSLYFSPCISLLFFLSFSFSPFLSFLVFLVFFSSSSRSVSRQSFPSTLPLAQFAFPEHGRFADLRAAHNTFGWSVCPAPDGPSRTG